VLKELILTGLSTLPSGVKKSIVNVGFNLEREHFQEMATRHLFAPDMRLGLQFLKSKGFNPERILDIGAYEANWSKMALAVWPNAKVTMIEANPEKAPILRKELPEATLIESLLGADERDVSFQATTSG